MTTTTTIEQQREDNALKMSALGQARQFAYEVAAIPGGQQYTADEIVEIAEKFADFLKTA